MSRKSPNSRPSRDFDSASTPTGEERLQKVLAAAGIGSRRDCEELIQQGRVEVDGQTVTALGTKVDPLRQEVRVDGTALRRPKRIYFLLNKPEGVVCTNYDQSGRTRVIDLVPSEERLFPVGRLDRSSEGLIVVTNDGAFANRLTHPRYGVEKTYLVRVAGETGEKELAKLRKGIHLSDGLAKVVSLKVKGRHKQSTELEIVLNEGKNREIRRILARVGHKVLWLKRTAVGPLKLGNLVPGEWRKLASQEVTELMELTKQRRKESKSSRPTAVLPVPRPQAASPKSDSPPPRQAPGSKKAFDKSAKPTLGKRPPSPTAANPAPKSAAPRSAMPPADDLLRLEDFLPPLSDDEGDELDVPVDQHGPATPGRVLDYGEDPAAPPAARPPIPPPLPFVKRPASPPALRPSGGKQAKKRPASPRPAGKKPGSRGEGRAVEGRKPSGSKFGRRGKPSTGGKGKPGGNQGKRRRGKR